MTNQACEADQRVAALPFYIVGVGASAGGLEALQAFFRECEPGHGIAYVVVQHLSPDFKSMMAELLGPSPQQQRRHPAVVPVSEKPRSRPGNSANSGLREKTQTCGG